jgi:predicted phosphate transport protein (TIGR00153 family)
MGFNIFDLLLPRETKFFTYMDQQVGFVVKGAAIFNDLVLNIKTLSEEQIKAKLIAIKECETKGDEVERTIFDELNKTFITPIDREDIHVLAINIDRALDILNSISRKVEIYNIREVPPNVCKFSEIIVNIAKQMELSVKQLQKKAYLDEVVNKMHSLENEADELFHVSMAELFNDKNNPIHIIKFKEFYEHLESVVDAIDYVGKLVRGIKVKIG